MALGKPRSARRGSSSSTSYCSSTITMLVFVVFCVLALWMLTSSSVVPSSQSTTTRISGSQFPRPMVRHKEPPAFSDTQELPDDAVKGDISDHKAATTQAVLETARDPEVTAHAEQLGGGEKLEDLNKEAKEQMNEQENQDSNGSDNAGKNEDSDNTQQGKEEEESNQSQQQDKEEEISRGNHVHSGENQQEEEEENQEAESTENQQQNEQGTEEESKEMPQQNQQETELESKQDQQQDTANENNETPTNSEGQQQETENQEEKQQQSQQEIESESKQNQQENQQETVSEIKNESSEQSQQDAVENPTDETIQENTQEAKSFEEQQHQQLQEDAAQQTQSTEQVQTAQESPEKATGIPKESQESKESWSTQENQSENQKERSKDDYTWDLCNVTAGADYIPCLDNDKALAKIRGRQHYEHRERHCPEEGPTCLVALPGGYKKSIEWPTSRDKIWYHNVPHTKLAEVKGHQNWVKVTGEFLTFPGGGTQFIHGALHYIDFIQKSEPKIAWGKHTRVVLDVGCGVASFGGFLFDRDVLTMSFAPKDEHEAQVQFALERGIPAISAVMGTQRLQFPARVFDMVHCARCRVPWHIEGGTLLLELNRVLRPGGFFVWSATPVYQKLPEDVEIWKAMSSLTASMCWELVTIKKDKLNGVGAAIYRKPMNNDCYKNRKHNKPPMCKDGDDPNAAWYVPLQACLHKVPVDESDRGSQWPETWPARVHKPPYWLKKSQKGIYGKSAPDDFASDYEHWKHVVTKTYMGGLGISWSNVRNVMDMRAVYGGFAAALKDLKVWVMNAVNVDGPDTLPIIYERGLFGIYHDWCESFSTYPRTYDLLHADHLFSSLKNRCSLLSVIAEVDRIVRPGGKFIVRDEENMIGEIENMLKSLHWEIQLTSSKDQEGILSAQKTDWRPETYSSSS